MRVHPLVRAAQIPRPGGTVTSEGFQGRLIGSPGVWYEIQGSTNLADWTVLQGNTADISGVIEFMDTDFQVFDYRFYKAVPR